MLVPNSVIVGGIPFKRVNKDTRLLTLDLASETDHRECTYAIRSDYSEARALTFFYCFVADYLLFYTGYNSEKADNMRRAYGNALYAFFLNNDVSWVYDPTVPIPDTFDIASLVYHVRYDKDEYLEAADALGENQHGTLEIAIDTRLTRKHRIVVLLHELTHALLYEQDIKEYTDESLIQPLAILFHQFIVDNKDLWNKVAIDLGKIKVPTLGPTMITGSMPLVKPGPITERFTPELIKLPDGAATYQIDDENVIHLTDTQVDKIVATRRERAKAELDKVQQKE